MPMPLDISHELSAGESVVGYMTAAGSPAALQIPAHASEGRSPESTEIPLNPVTTLLEDELKLHEMSGHHLWQGVQDALTLLWWVQPEGC